MGSLPVRIFSLFDFAKNASMSAFAGVAKWQTRWTQNPVVATPCGFNSLLRHQFGKAKTPKYEIEMGSPPEADPVAETLSSGASLIDDCFFDFFIVLKTII